MREDSASDTARLVARSLLLASKDKDLSRLVPPDEPAFLSKVLMAAGRHRPFELSLKYSFSRALLFRIERFLLPGIITHFLARKRRIEQEVRTAISIGIKNVTIIGAGFDSLAWRLCQEFPEVNFLELDHPATQRIKREAFGENSGVRFDTIDLTQANSDKHLLDLQISEPGIVVAEGLTMYLPEERVSALLKNADSIAGPDGSIVFTFMDATCETGYGFKHENKLIARWLQNRNEPFLWGIPKEELATFLKRADLKIIDHNGLTEEILALHNLQGSPLAQGECLCIFNPIPSSPV